MSEKILLRIEDKVLTLAMELKELQEALKALKEENAHLIQEKMQHQEKLKQLFLLIDEMDLSFEAPV